MVIDLVDGPDVPNLASTNKHLNALSKRRIVRYRTALKLWWNLSRPLTTGKTHSHATQQGTIRSPAFDVLRNIFDAMLKHEDLVACPKTMDFASRFWIRLRGPLPHQFAHHMSFVAEALQPVLAKYLPMHAARLLRLLPEYITHSHPSSPKYGTFVAIIVSNLLHRVETMRVATNLACHPLWHELMEPRLKLAENGMLRSGPWASLRKLTVYNIETVEDPTYPDSYINVSILSLPCLETLELHGLQLHGSLDVPRERTLALKYLRVLRGRIHPKSVSSVLSHAPFLAQWENTAPRNPSMKHQLHRIKSFSPAALTSIHITITSRNFGTGIHEDFMSAVDLRSLKSLRTLHIELCWLYSKSKKGACSLGSVLPRSLVDLIIDDNCNTMNENFRESLCRYLRSAELPNLRKFCLLLNPNSDHGAACAHIVRAFVKKGLCHESCLASKAPTELFPLRTGTGLVVECEMGRRSV
jgi:hypothetical protein